MSPYATVQSLLLAAPQAMRIHLAVASLLYAVRKEYVEVILPGQRQVIPVYLFFDEKRQYDVFFFSPELSVSLPGRAGKPSPDPVPFSGNISERTWQIQQSVHSSTVTCSQGKLVVQVSDGMQSWEECAPVSSCSQKERETGLLLARAMLQVYAPALLPLLDAQMQPDEGSPDTVQTRLIQEMVLIPVFLPMRLDNLLCQYQVFDLRSGSWRSCEQQWDGDEETYCPDQCPGCGAYYCDQHFSSTAYTFSSAQEDRRIYGTAHVTKKVCLACALLSEEAVKRLRAARLAINGEPEQRDEQPR